MPLTRKSPARLTWTSTALTALALSVALTACGGDPGQPGSPAAGKSGVASLATASTPGPARTTAAERPLIRSDMSDDDITRLYAVWNKCRVAHGIDTHLKPGPADEEKYMKVETACLSQRPEEVPERSQRLDPTWPDKMRDWAKCLTAKGYPTTLRADGQLSYDDPPHVNTDHQVYLKWAAVMQACQKQAFGI